ncbi:hypothetical protein OAT84_02715 [Gammaproteobacteria bacterium]|nr:hypothetical protein [Gammaproteobacteria bacterium]
MSEPTNEQIKDLQMQIFGQHLSKNDGDNFMHCLKELEATGEQIGGILASKKLNGVFNDKFPDFPDGYDKDDIVSADILKSSKLAKRILTGRQYSFSFFNKVDKLRMILKKMERESSSEPSNDTIYYITNNLTSFEISIQIWYGIQNVDQGTGESHKEQRASYELEGGSANDVRQNSIHRQSVDVRKEEKYKRSRKGFAAVFALSCVGLIVLSILLGFEILTLGAATFLIGFGLAASGSGSFVMMETLRDQSYQGTQGKEEIYKRPRQGLTAVFALSFVGLIVLSILLGFEILTLGAATFLIGFGLAASGSGSFVMMETLRDQSYQGTQGVRIGEKKRSSPNRRHTLSDGSKQVGMHKNMLRESISLVGRSRSAGQAVQGEIDRENPRLQGGSNNSIQSRVSVNTPSRQ